VLDLVPSVPALTWSANSWNSNSVVAWLLERSGIGASAARLPPNGGAPGWDAGLIV
jgi:hypothetical protein